MAQVYSLNSVGYINVAIPTGFSIISDQLYANGQGVSQTVSPLLDTQVLDGNHSGFTFYKFTAGPSGGYFVFSVTPGNAWSLDPVTSVNAASECTLNPGEAMYVYNPGAATSFTFVGTVPQGSGLTVNLLPGFNLISSIVPESALIDSVEGLVPTHGDTLYLYDSTTYGVVAVTPTGAWTTQIPNTLTPPDGTAPSPAIGGGIFYYSAAASATTWTRTFNIQ